MRPARDAVQIKTIIGDVPVIGIDIEYPGKPPGRRQGRDVHIAAVYQAVAQIDTGPA